MWRRILVFVFIGFLYTACESELDVSREGDEVVVVYGLLNKNELRHYVKISKSFIGDSDALVLAKNRDSSELKGINPYILRYSNGQLTGDEPILLEDTLVSGKEDGLFYGPEQTLYTFQKALDPQSTYEIVIEKGNKITRAQTLIIDNFTLLGGGVFSSATIDLNMYSSGTYGEQDFEWVSQPNAKGYQLVVNFAYEDHLISGGLRNVSVDWYHDRQTSTTILGGQSMFQTLQWESFYQYIGTKIPSLLESNDVKYRIPGKVSFRLVMIAEDLNTYIEVDKAQSNFFQSKPEFTNVVDGIGLFSSRIHVAAVHQKSLNKSSLLELYNGDYTRALGFCDAGALVPCE